MALFRKKKTDTDIKSEQKDEKKSDGTLDLIKEAMNEAKEAKSNNMNDMPTEEEIRKAQEVLARAQKKVAPNTADLKTVIADFLADKSKEKLDIVMDCLKNPKTVVCVPAQISTSKENDEKMKQGGQVKLEGPVRITPVILTDNKGKKVFPIFTSEDEIPEDIKQKTPKVNMPFSHCINLMKNLKDIDTFALNPYSANIRIAVSVQTNN